MDRLIIRKQADAGVKKFFAGFKSKNNELWRITKDWRKESGKG